MKYKVNVTFTCDQLVAHRSSVEMSGDGGTVAVALGRAIKKAVTHPFFARKRLRTGRISYLVIPQDRTLQSRRG